MDSNDPLAHVMNARLVYHLPGEDRVSVTKNIPFKTVADLTLHLDVYAPPDLLPTETRPAVLHTLAPLTYLQHHPQRMPPLLIARMEHDMSGLNVAVDAFVTAAADVHAPVELVNHPDGHHGFDTEDDNEQSRAIIMQTLSFMQRHLRQVRHG